MATNILSGGKAAAIRAVEMNTSNVTLIPVIEQDASDATIWNVTFGLSEGQMAIGLILPSFSQTNVLAIVTSVIIQPVNQELGVPPSANLASLTNTLNNSANANFGLQNNNLYYKYAFEPMNYDPVTGFTNIHKLTVLKVSFQGTN
jgi:hypothetical protein